jgi:L-alanine-DL-glutamate epimerase-like enolase superfamily enzyme
MKPEAKITKLEVTTFEYELENVGKDYNTFNMVYEPNGRLTQRGSILTMHTDQGVVGEYPVTGPALAEVSTASQYLIGKNALEREMIYNDTKRGLRHGAMLGVGVIDILLWDIAGKLYDEPV